MWYILGIIIAIIVIRLLIVDDKNYKIKKQEWKKLEEYHLKMKENNFVLKIDSDTTKIYVNEKNKTWTIACEEKIYNFSDVIACELLENNVTIFNAVSQKHVSLGKALVGDALFGPVGAIIGGTSGKTTTISEQQEMCSDLKIKITLNDLEQPCKFIELVNTGILKQSEEYKEKYEIGQKIISLFQVIINNK